VALVLVRLRLIIAARNRGNGASAGAYYVTTWVVGGVFGLIAGTGTAVFVSEPALGNVLLLGSFIALSLPWLIGPILEPTLADGTVDPRRLEQFPLTTWQQVSGLLTGALIAPTATFTLLFAAGSVAAFGQSPIARLAALASAIAYTVMCVAISRSAQALLAQSLRSRRGRDFAALLAALMVLGLYALAMHLRTTLDSITSQLSGPVGLVAAWLPPGASAQSIIDARDGHWVDYAARMAVVLGTIALAMLAWAWSLARRVKGDNSSLGRGYHRSTVEVLPLIPTGLRFLPATTTTAAVAQQWRYFFFRSPKAIQTLIIPPVMGIMVAHSTFSGIGMPAQTASFASLAVVVGSFNVFGYDGPGFRFLIGSGAKLSNVLVGKVLAPLLYLVPLLVVFASVEGLLQARPGEIWTAILAGLAVILTGVGIGSQSSVLNPNDQSRIGHHRQGMFLKVFAWFSGFFTVVSIGAVGWILLDGALGPDLTAVVMLLASAALAAILLTQAGRRLDRDPATMLARLAPAEY
jgi:ABC-2 type transport system permease protein